jgi:hypothetical protein
MFCDRGNGMTNNLRNASKRLVVDPYINNHHTDKINIIAAPTGVGKTYSIMHELIPSDISMGFNKFIVLTVYRDNVYQDTRAYEEALFGKAIVTGDMSHFLSYKGAAPIVLISTIAGSTMGGSRSDADLRNDQLLLTFIEKFKGKIALYWDEAHFGGSSNRQTYGINTGQPSRDFLGYNATYYTFIENACDRGCKVTGFTATPLFEQQELLPTLSNGYYEFLTNANEWPTPLERTEIGSQYKDIVLYDTDIDFGYSLRKGLIEFASFSEQFVERANLINSFNLGIGALKKPVLLIATGRENTKSGYEIVSAVETILDFYKNRMDEKAFFIGTATQDGYFMFNILRESKRLTQTQFFEAISDDDNPLCIIGFIEKFKFGLNLSNVTHEIHLRERASIVDGGYGHVTVPVIQTYGRAVRTWFGVKNDDLKSVFVSDAVAYLRKFAGYKVYDVLREHMLNSNSHTFYVPDNPLYRKSIAEWKDRYAVSIDMSQFSYNHIESSVSTLFSQQEDVCPTCKRPFHDHSEFNAETFSKALGIAA